MRVDLTEEEVIVDIDGAKFTFKKVNTLTAHESLTAIYGNGKADLKEIIPIAKKYLRKIEGVFDENEKEIDVKDFARLPHWLIVEVYGKFIAGVDAAFERPEDKDMGAEEKNDALPVLDS